MQTLGHLKRRMEVGSYFEIPRDDILLPKGRNFVFDKFIGAQWTCSGRDSFIALAKNFSERKTLHIPNFYCPLTLAILEKFFEIKTFEDLPTVPTPRFDTINAQAGDIVMALDIFGIRTQDTWKNYFINHPDIISLEDHSHAPFSSWAQNSDADFSMASLRKSFPIACGGYIWGKNYRHFAGKVGGRHEDDELGAQFLKSLYMDGRKINPAIFTKLFHNTEQHFNANATFHQMGDVSKEILMILDIEKIQQRRKANFEFLKNAIQESGDFYEFINADTSNIMSLFNPMLMLKSNELRELLRKDLCFRRIYATVLWELERASVSADAFDVSSRIIDIPLDFRCSEQHVAYVADALNNFAKKHG